MVLVTPTSDVTSAPAVALQDNTLAQLASQTPACWLRAQDFFVSWSGVLTLAYTSVTFAVGVCCVTKFFFSVVLQPCSGFPPSLIALKDKLSRHHSELPKENPGSKWPKTSLAALKDNKRLTPEQLRILRGICMKYHTTLYEKGCRVRVDHACVIMYKQRSLEQIIHCHKLELLTSNDDDTPPSQAELDNVQVVLRESDSDDYWFSASKDGNRESHYRGPAIGATLVAKVNDATMHVQPGAFWTMQEILRRFREDIDSYFPDLYAWFDNESLHVTIRALIG